MNYFFSFDKMKYVKADHSKKCILCGIANKENDIPDLSVLHVEDFILSVNLYPYNPGHLIVFPTKHILDIREFSEQENHRLVVLQNRALNILDAVYSPAGYNIGYNMGNTAGASIDHIHLHIIPRFPNEIGIADLIAHKRVLVESPFETQKRIKQYLQNAC